jgi:glycerol kinase
LGDVADADDGVLVLGTGGFVVVPTGRTPRHVSGLLTTLLYEDVDGPVFALEGTVHGLASGIVEAGRRGGWAELPAERIAARSGPATRIPKVDAAVEGTGTPDWDQTPRFEVEDGEFSPEEIVRGTVEGLAGRFGRIAELLRADGVCPERFLATGGMAAAPHLTARIADRMSVSLVVDPRPQRTAVGAALLARDGK